MDRRFLIQPPLAFARIGLSETPLDWLLWGPNDNSVHGTGKTTLFQCIGVDKDGYPIPAAKEEPLTFRDREEIRPVCPYFELNEITEGGSETAVTDESINPADLVWTVTLGNRKAHYRTHSEGDKITGEITASADKPGFYSINGWSASGSPPLVFEDHPIYFGRLEILDTPPGHPFRVRFWPPKGKLYGPKNIYERTQVFGKVDDPDRPVEPVLNPEASWPNWNTDTVSQNRDYIARLTMQDDNDVSLGIVDDTSDGFVRCTYQGKVVATARLAIGPPHYAPDRRYLISCADGLKDREDRDEPLPGGEGSEEWKNAAGELVLDILERAFESTSLMNLESLVDRYENIENPEHAFSSDQAWNRSVSGTFDIEALRAETLEEFPLSETARRKHRQFLSMDLLKRYIRQRPELLKQLLRPPVGNNQYYNRQMPPLQRGSDARPLHLTRRQYDLILRWANSLGDDE